MRDKDEEMDYHVQRTKTFEIENNQLRMGNKSLKKAQERVEELQNELDAKRIQLRAAEKKVSEEFKGGVQEYSSYESWSKERLIYEIKTIDNAIERFSIEN